MTKFVEINQSSWSYVSSVALSPLDIVERLAWEVTQGIADYSILSIDSEHSNELEGFQRVSVELAVSVELFDAFFNSRTGYRAQYYHSEATGEAYNKIIVDRIAPLLIASKLHAKDVTYEFCEKSLYGPYTKLWFPKEVTSPSYEQHLLLLPEAIKAKRWYDFWAEKNVPRKGLLAPKPQTSSILLNGTFMRFHDWQAWNQKPNRSTEIHLQGWT